MKRIGHNLYLKNYFQILSSYGIKKVVPAQQDFEMEWTLKKEEKRTFVEFVSKVVTIEKNARLNQGKLRHSTIFHLYNFISYYFFILEELKIWKQFFKQGLWPIRFMWKWGKFRCRSITILYN